MTNVSKKQLQTDEYRRLSKQFSNTLARLTAITSEGFIDDLLGPEEKTMLIKRLAAIVMYGEGYSSYRVAQTLNISPATANTIRIQFESGSYENIRKLFVRHKTDYRKLLNIIDTISRAGLPPLAGPGRWGELASVRGTRSKQK
ncbi:MAG TPA: hypothetical protein VKP88_01260 [Candidatus Paceibacterota bacterium]|nr:hypothetical protein [Candidatus Paceibacterota bacterium]